jgi:predicted glycoside hydrolase/deacetylase ChbG (UPF0249 family)
LKRLLVNADDFGFTRDVNDGIVEAHRRGILTATTLMANGAAFDHAVELALATPTLDVGCHLVLASGRSLARAGENLPRDVKALAWSVARGGFPIEEELEAQVKRIRAAGIKPTHLDTHKHTHILPPVLAAVARVASRNGIRWVRRPFDLPLSSPAVPLTRRALSNGLGFLRTRFHRVLERHGCATTDHFAGFQLTGLYGAEELAALLRALPDGLTEFMCHPGFCTDELRAARTRLKESRQRELDALTSPAVREALEQSGIHLARYRELT